MKPIDPAELLGRGSSRSLALDEPNAITLRHKTRGRDFSLPLPGPDRHKIFLCPQVSRGERALSQSSSNSSFLSDVRTSNDSSMGATQWQFQRAENPWSTVLRCVAPALGLVCDQDARFPSVPFCRHARTLADANTHWQSLSLR